MEADKIGYHGEEWDVEFEVAQGANGDMIQ